jgi:hypothetical protein
MNEAQKQLIAAVKAYALEHYNHGAWDVLIECWSDEDIASRSGIAEGVTDERTAIVNAGAYLELTYQHRLDIESEAF